MERMRFVSVNIEDTDFHAVVVDEIDLFEDDGLDYVEEIMNLCTEFCCLEEYQL